MSRVRAPNDGAAARHDSRLPRGVNAATGIIIFRTYQQHPDDEWTKPALDLIFRDFVDTWAVYDSSDYVPFVLDEGSRE